MKKKRTLLATLVLSGLMSMPALADGVMSLQGIGSEGVTAPVEGKYYVIQGHSQHSTITWLYDNGEGLTATEAAEPGEGPESMKYVWTFESSDEGYAAKNLTTGRYIHIAGTGSGGAVEMQNAPSYFTISVGNDEDPNVVALKKNGYDQWIDMGYTGMAPTTWSGGVGGSRRMYIYEAEVGFIGELEAAMARLNTCWGKYEPYLPNWGNETFDRGPEIGQYNVSDEDYNLFVENLSKAKDILYGEITDVTAEEIDEIIENIEKGYAAIINSLVTLTIADGNYRIVSAMEWTNTERVETGEYDEDDQPIYDEIVTHPLKAMYATMDGNAMWANLDSTDCRYLWKMTNNPETGYIQMMNIATDGILHDCSSSAQAVLQAESTTEMLFMYEGRNEDGKIIVSMKCSTRGDYGFLHCNQHGGGAGKASNIVGWTHDADVSQWILEPVSDEEVDALVEAFAPIKNHEKLVADFQALIAETESAIAQAKDDSYVIDRSSAGLITSTDQFSSPFSESKENEGNNCGFEFVLSDDGSTYWHSSWVGGSQPMHTHYFQVAFAEPIEGAIQCYMHRRAGAANDHITELGVFGTNDESILESTAEDGWTNLGSFDLSKNAANGLTTYSLNTIALPEGYQYLRFYIDGTTNMRGYAHFAMFQLYNATINGNTQWSQMGEAAAAIDSALATAKAVDLDEIVYADYDALKEAYDAFKALLVDVSALAAAIEANKNVTDLVVVGDAPGFWSADSDVSAFAETVKEADAYLRAGAYTQAQADDYTAAITSGAANIMAAANPVQEGKWYAIKYDSEENFDKHQWNKLSAVNTTLGDLFDNYAAPAFIEGEGEDQQLIGFSALEEVTIGQTVRFINEDVIYEMDQLAFRFVAQGDSAYVIQHKSGLYLGGATRSTNLTLGLTPALFNVKAVGYGKVTIEARNLKGEGYYADGPVYLHAQNDGHSLVTWSTNDVGSSSALYIEPIDESDLDEGNDVSTSGSVMKVKPNSMKFICYPTAFTVENAEIYAYQGASDVPETRADEEEEGTKLANYLFNKIEQAEPGQPVLLVVGTPEDFDANPEEEEEPAEIRITPAGSSFAPDPLTTGGVHGTYTYQWVDEGSVVVSWPGQNKNYGQEGNTLVLAEGEDNTDATRDISANTGWIVYGENVLKNANIDEYDLVITAERPVANGDLNGDGTIDIADAVMILNLMAEGSTSAAADLNNDGTIDIADFVMILNMMAGQ